MPAGRPANPVKKLINRIKEIETFLEQTSEHADIRTKSGMQARQQQFLQELESIRDDYAKLMRGRGIAVFVLGDRDQQAAFAAIATDYDSFVLDANALYRTLANKVWPAIRVGELFTAGHAQIVAEHMITIGQALNLPSIPYPTPTVDLVRAVTDKEMLVGLIRGCIEHTAKTELLSAYLESQAIDAAINERYSGGALSVLVVDANTDQIQDLQRRIFKATESSAPRTFVISIGPDATGLAELTIDSVDEDSVIRALGLGAKKFGLSVSKRPPKANNDKPAEEVVQSVSDTKTEEQNNQ